jgi:hypothetical protein
VNRPRTLVLPFLAMVILSFSAIPTGARAAADPFAEGCPKETLKEGAATSLNHNPATKKTIVPAGATSLRICRYWGFGNEQGRQTPKTQARVGTLNDQAEVKNRPLLEGLTYEFKELNPAPKGPISCPEDDGAELYAIFFYPHAEPVIVHVALEGCRFAYSGGKGAGVMTTSLQRKLVRLAKGEGVKAAPEPSGVKEKGVAEYGAPRITVAVAKHSAKGDLEEACKQSKLCASSAIGACTRRSAKSIGCRYSAELKTGERCHGSIGVTRIEGPILEVSPGVQNEKEGECFYLWTPPGFKEEMEEEEREEAQEAERGKRSSRATGQSPKRT